nr:GNAT family N-acetyltransferase [Priestia taiwanensis]
MHVLGIIDLCVKQTHRSQGVGSLLLREIDVFCQRKNN